MQIPIAIQIIFIVFIFGILCVCAIYFDSWQKKLTEKTIHLKDLEQAIQKGQTFKIKEAEQKLSLIEEKIQQKEQKFNQKYNFEEQSIQTRLKNYEEIKRKSIDQQLESHRTECKVQKIKCEQELVSLRQEIQAAAASLQTLKQTRKAAYQALLRQKEMEDKKDDYRLLPSQIDLSDIKKLQKVKLELAKPRILSMLIWQTYWQPLAKTKFPIILKDKTKMGVYKITNIETNECYIGQAVDIYKRWNQHCKAGLGIDTPPGNKLYKAIMDYGLQNFTFEILLECNRDELNEKEKYFISLYQADTYGYNGNIGVNKK